MEKNKKEKIRIMQRLFKVEYLTQQQIVVEVDLLVIMTLYPSTIANFEDP